MSVEDSGGQGFSGGEVFQGQQDTGDQAGSINPAWNDMLSAIPSEHHSKVIPHLQRWDKGVQDRFNQVHSQYEGYRPFIDQQIAPQDIEFSMGLLNAINNDPASVYQALGQWMEQEGITAEDLAQEDEQGQSDQIDLSNHPDYQRMSQMVNQMADIMVSQREQEQQDADDDELDQELDSLREQYGDYDESFVLSRMYSGMSGEEAVQEYQQFVQGILSGQRRPGPKVLGAGGSLPQNNVNVKGLNRQDTRSLVENMLRMGAQQE